MQFASCEKCYVENTTTQSRTAARAVYRLPSRDTKVFTAKNKVNVKQVKSHFGVIFPSRPRYPFSNLISCSASGGIMQFSTLNALLCYLLRSCGC